MPDATAALAAARQLVAAGGPYTIEAAEFLIERSDGPAAMIDPLRDERLAELVAEVGPAETFAALHAAEDVTLADENGRVLSNGGNSLAELRCMAERAVAGEAPDCPAAQWLGAQ